jgi:hypothetical protein
MEVPDAMHTIHNVRVQLPSLRRSPISGSTRSWPARIALTADVLTRSTPQLANLSLALLVFLGLSLAAVDAIRADCKTTNQYEKGDLGAFIADDLGLPTRVVPGRERQCIPAFTAGVAG